MTHNQKMFCYLMLIGGLLACFMALSVICVLGGATYYLLTH